MPSKPLNIVNLEKFKDTCLFSITLRKWANRGQVKDMNKLAAYLEQLKAETDEANGTNGAEPSVFLASDRIKTSKILLKSSAYVELTQKMGEAKKWVLSRSMPSYFRAGMFVVKQDKVPDHENQLRKLLAEIKAEDGPLERFIKALPIDIEMARTALVSKGGLGPLFDLADYPTPDEMRELFDMEWYWLSIGVPENIPAELQAEAGEKFKRRLMSAAEDIENALREEFQKLIAHAEERLTVAPGESPKVFRNTIIGNLVQFCETFDSKNVFNDDRLTDIVTQARSVLLDEKGNAKVDAQRLRDSKETREMARDKFTAMRKALDEMIATKKSRQFDLED